MYSLASKKPSNILEIADFERVDDIFFQKKVIKKDDFTLFLLYLKIKERFFKKLLTGDFFSLYYASFSRQQNFRENIALLHNQYTKKVRFPCNFGTLNIEKNIQKSFKEFDHSSG